MPGGSPCSRLLTRRSRSRLVDQPLVTTSSSVSQQPNAAHEHEPSNAAIAAWLQPRADDAFVDSCRSRLDACALISARPEQARAIAADGFGLLFLLAAPPRGGFDRA